MQKVLALSDQVRAALSEPTTSEALKGLIESTGFEVEATRQRLQAAKAKAVDPMSSNAEAAEARREHHDLGFEEERQTSSVARLKHRLTEVLAAEEEGRRQAAYDALMADHGALANKLRERYPVLAAEIAGMLDEVTFINERTRVVNQNKPKGAAWVQPVEQVARGPVIGERRYTTELVYDHPISLVRGVSLPKFASQEAKGMVGYLWLGIEKAD